jgi:hypothetical protein
MAPISSGWSGEFPPGWVCDEPFALWQTQASASIRFNIEGHAEYKNEFSPAQLEFDGSGSVNGDLKVGVYAVAQVAGYTGEGEAGVTAGISYTVTVEGVSPNRKIMGEFAVQPVTLNAELKLVRDSDGESIASFSFSQVIWDGWTQNPKTVLYGQPANP